MKTHWKPQELDRWDALIGAAVLLGTFWLFMATLEIGYTRDESFYFHAAAEYIGWFEDLWKNLWNPDFPSSLAESFSKENIDKHWNYNPEHPVLVKTLFALSHKLFFDKLGWLSESDALRLPGAAFGSMALLCAYAFGRQCFGRLAGVVAVGALIFQPRFFFNAHLTCFDVPIAALWVMVVYAYWRSLESKRWAWVTGVLFGLALSAKLNAFFLPIVLCGHWFLLYWRGFGRVKESGEGDAGEGGEEAAVAGQWTLGKFRLPPIPWGLVAMAILGPILFHVLWPYHWYDTWPRVEWYLNFHLKHVHYFVWYFAERLDDPPFPIGFPWVMTLVTVPATLLLTFGFGVWAAMRQWRFVDWARQWIAALRERKLPATRAPEAGFDPRATGLLIAINFIFPIALISMPSTPVFGGTKHWIASMVFLSILVGAGVSMAVEMALRALNERGETPDADADTPPPRPATRALLAVVLSLAVLGPAAYATWYNHPFGTSYYNELIGSYRGAADAGMMRQYWGYASRQSLPWVNEHAPKNGRVWTHNTTSWAWNMYKKDGIARKDLRPTSINASQIGIYHHQRAFTWEREKLWTAYGTRTPSHVVDIDGVPLVTVYERPKKKASKPLKKNGEKIERPEK
ncbi:ArnT family glycosyltransferase [Bradymonas sediminis]|uniref:Uncharacterized protein n=1 Tax=Bradymonas sediminis TaxID=1548548 RepID=A0A2Z4FQB3_9DELT|nr:glycosyltransferase family 39 protein [Bradymonas sediminis]AWV91217.1 hypothetical protein DN745_18555 [Bradymonas sediminis]TDP73784.1 dolichyl-phosphate-mannose-protein mannosyltransferase [Bradymonas sediminis]